MRFLGHDKVVELLLQKGANIDAGDRTGETVLHKAAREGTLILK